MDFHLLLSGTARVELATIGAASHKAAIAVMFAKGTALMGASRGLDRIRQNLLSFLIKQ
jgi:hypothetical protein